MTKRILYVASREFLPVVGGRERMISQSVKWLAQAHEVALAVFSKEEINDVSPYRGLGVKSVTSIPLNGFWSFLFCLLSRPDFSAQECLYYSSYSIKVLNKIIQENNPDIVVFDMLRTACLAQNIRANKKYLEMDDLLSDRYRKFIREENTANALGTFSNRVPRLMAKLFRPFQNRLISREERILCAAELMAPRKFDMVFLTSHIEARILGEATGAKNIYALPPSVMVAPPVFDDVQRGVDFAKPVKAIFIGNMRTQQNKDSLRYIVNEIILKLKKNDIQISLSVIGVYDEEFVSEIASNITHERVNFLGFVSDLHQVIKDADFAFMPIAHGTGICTKILEVMMYGLPVITNKNGVRGLDVVSAWNILIFETINEFLQVIDNLKSGVYDLDAIARRGRDYVINNFENSKLSIEYVSKFN